MSPATLLSFPLVVLIATSVTPARGQSLYLKAGEHAVEASAGWSVGPSSHGIETYASVGINGRVDIGVAVSRYTTIFDDGSESSYDEYAPFVRVLLLEQSFRRETYRAARISVLHRL